MPTTFSDSVVSWAAGPLAPCTVIGVVTPGVAKAFAFGVFVRSIVQVVDVPEQSFDHPVNAEPVFGVAVSTMVVAVGYATEQAAMQLTFPSLEVMVPDPVPDTPTVRVRSRSKVAVTLGSCEVVTEHDAVPVQAPLHPTKCDPAAAVASSVTDWLPEYDVVQGEVAVAQVAPVGLESATLPVPVPLTVVVSVLLPEPDPMVTVAVAAVVVRARKKPQLAQS